MDTKIKREKKDRRHRRVRAKIIGTKEIPRLCVFRSNRHIYAQLIDDTARKTLAAAGDLEIKQKTKNKKQKTKSKNEKTEENKKTLTGKIAIAYKIGQLIAQEAQKKKIKKVVFDRGGYRYHGRVRALAEGARKGGLIF